MQLMTIHNFTNNVFMLQKLEIKVIIQQKLTINSNLVRHDSFLLKVE